mgnify:CR=1 FL=1
MEGSRLVKNAPVGKEHALRDREVGAWRSTSKLLSCLSKEELSRALPGDSRSVGKRFANSFKPPVFLNFREFLARRAPLTSIVRICENAGKQGAAPLTSYGRSCKNAGSPVVG